MKHTWEEKDIKAGTYVQVGSTDDITGTYIIGYDPSEDTPKKLRLISLADGMIMGHSFSSVEKLTSHLNKSGYRPLRSRRIRRFLENHVKKEHGKPK